MRAHLKKPDLKTTNSNALHPLRAKNEIIDLQSNALVLLAQAQQENQRRQLYDILDMFRNEMKPLVDEMKELRRLVDRVYSLQEVSERTGFSMTKLYQEVRSGNLRAFRAGGKRSEWRITQSELMEYINRKHV